MQELVGRLTALDPGATESVRVIAFFDALVAARSSQTSLLRAATALAGCPVGWIDSGGAVRLRLGTDGGYLAPGAPSGWPGHRVADGGLVWIEREDGARAHDAMLLERLALALALARPSPDSHAAPGAAELVVDRLAPLPERREAARCLRLSPDDRARAVAVLRPPGSSGQRGEVATPWGLMGVTILTGATAWSGGPAGVGSETRVDDLPESWAAALVALRARAEGEHVGWADDLGSLVALTEAIDAGASVPHDVHRVEALLLAPEMARTLTAVVDTTSVRGAASRLGVHHSTVRARLDQAGDSLGFDPTSPHGRTRLDLALTLARVRSFSPATAGKQTPSPAAP